MKKKLNLVFLPVILLFSLLLEAQTLDSKNNFEIEIDPIAYLLKGYSFHAIYNHKNIRYDLGVFGLEVPESISGNENYTAFSSGVGLKINYLFKPSNSFYTGIDFGIGETKITSKVNQDSDESHDVTIGIHGGYRFFLFRKKTSFWKGLYLTPWIGVSYNHFYEKAKFEDYKHDKIGYFATVHLGYRF